jgi:hypothetical protein
LKGWQPSVTAVAPYEVIVTTPGTSLIIIGFAVT